MVHIIHSGPISIFLRAVQTELFVRPQHYANGSVMLVADLLQQVRHLHGMRTSRAIVLRPLAQIPRVNVTAHQHNLISLIRAFKICNDIVIRRCALNSTVQEQL